MTTDDYPDLTTLTADDFEDDIDTRSMRYFYAEARTAEIMRRLRWYDDHHQTPELPQPILVPCPTCNARVIIVLDFAGGAVTLNARDDETPEDKYYDGPHSRHICPTP